MAYPTPAQLNNYPLLFIAEHRNCTTVMVWRNDHDYQPYAVATVAPNIKKGWLWGHYCDTREQAEECFLEVAERNEQR